MLSEVITRLENAEEGSISLDDAINDALDGNGALGVTTSLDIALALAERVLPGWTWEITIDGCGSVQGAPEMWPEGLAAPDRDGVSADARTPALALCIAILRALNLNETRHAE